MSLGSGRSSAEDKGKAMVVKFHHETGDISSLKAVCQRVASFTTDMGTELGLPELGGGGAEAYLPNYMQSDLKPDDDAMGGLFQSVHQEVSGADQGYLFPKALVVPGLDHIAHNMQEDMDKHLRHMH